MAGPLSGAVTGPEGMMQSGGKMALEGVEGAWMGMLCAHIRDLIWPMQESAKDSKRLALSTRSVYSTISKSAWESFWLASVDLVASLSRSCLMLVRIWFAVTTCSVALVDEVKIPGGYSCVKI